jgi:hypothetical protein
MLLPSGYPAAFCEGSDKSANARSGFCVIKIGERRKEMPPEAAMGAD